METHNYAGTPAYQTRIITFGADIPTLDRFFADYQTWGVSTLKQWVDAYESTRFTQISERQAVITSEYNMEHVMEWLEKHMPVVPDARYVAITDTVDEVVDVIITREVNPNTFGCRVQSLMLSGMTKDEAENYAVDNPMQLSLFYDIGRGGFAIDAETVGNTPLYNPYTGREIPDETV